MVVKLGRTTDYQGDTVAWHGVVFHADSFFITPSVLLTLTHKNPFPSEKSQVGNR